MPKKSITPTPFPWLAARIGGVQKRLTRVSAPSAGQRRDELARINGWLSSPLCLWPVDIVAVAEIWLGSPTARKRAEATALLEWLGDPPAEAASTIAGAHEIRSVRTGDYSSFFAAGHKFDEAEHALGKDRGFKAAWAKLITLPGMKRYLARKPVVRRSPVSERGYRAWLDEPGTSALARCQRVFDAFCHRWSLYGMHGHRPLLLKPTVNLTPFGTIIFVPNYWSLDPKRDICWSEVTQLHQLGRRRQQGTGLTDQRREKLEKARALQIAWAEVTAAGQRGEARIESVLKVLDWPPGTDDRTLRQLRRLVVD